MARTALAMLGFSLCSQAETLLCPFMGLLLWHDSMLPYDVLRQNKETRYYKRSDVLEKGDRPKKAETIAKPEKACFHGVTLHTMASYREPV
jgi:hypothetical protein